MKLKTMVWAIACTFVAGMTTAAAQAVPAAATGTAAGTAPAAAPAKADAEASNDAVSSINMTTVSVKGGKTRTGNGLIMKLGRNFHKVREVLGELGLAERQSIELQRNTHRVRQRDHGRRHTAT